MYDIVIFQWWMVSLIFNDSEIFDRRLMNPTRRGTGSMDNFQDIWIVTGNCNFTQWRLQTGTIDFRIIAPAILVASAPKRNS